MICRNHEIERQLSQIEHQLCVQNALLREIAKALIVRPADTSTLARALLDLQNLAPQPTQEEKEKENDKP